MSNFELHQNPLNRMQSAIQQAGFHYIVCLKAYVTNADYKVKIKNTEYSFDAVRRTDGGLLHAEFQHWAAKTVLRDLVESFSFFLTEIYRDAIAAKPEVGYSTTLARFERLGIEEQLTTLAKDFVIDERWIIRLVGYNRARNCLAHRHGVVGSRDATDGNDLVIRWLVTTIKLADVTIADSIDAGIMNSLIHVQHVQGKPAKVEVTDKEKRARVGSRLSFLPTDILEICQTFQMAAAAFSNLSSGS